MRQLAFVVVLVALASGCAGQREEAQKFAVSGEVSVYYMVGQYPPDPIEDGDDVEVRDGSTNEMLALGHLQQISGDIGQPTLLSFTVEGVPEGHQFYSVIVDNRPPRRFARAELSTLALSME